jgi:hypothetical protein
MGAIDWNGVSDSTWIIKSAGGGARSRLMLPQVKEKMPNANLNSIQGGNAITITAAISAMVDTMKKCPCTHGPMRTQGSGVPQGNVGPTTAEVCDSIAEDSQGNFYVCSVNHVLNVCWMSNGTFVDNLGNDVAAGDHEAVGELAMKIFAEALDMGLMAHQFPRAIFTVGANADTWNVDERYDFYATIARIGLAMTGHNVASGVHDHAAIAMRKHSVKKEGSGDS